MRSIRTKSITLTIKPKTKSPIKVTNGNKKYTRSSLLKLRLHESISQLMQLRVFDVANTLNRYAKLVKVKLTVAL